jgi:putative ABC transport system permease protein
MNRDINITEQAYAEHPPQSSTAPQHHTHTLPVPRAYQPPLLPPRWKKVLTDLWSNPTRTLLVVLSIFIGVFAVGMIATSHHILTNQLQATYMRTNPADLIISIGVSGYNADFTIESAVASLKGFDQELVEAVRHMESVEDAEGRRVFSAQVRTGAGHWQTIQFIAIDDYDDMRVNTIAHMHGTWPPDDHEVLIERSSMSGPQSLHGAIGDTLLVELPDGKQREMPIVGVVHDMHQWPTPFLGTIYAYITMDTVEWLGEPRELNQMSVLVAGDSASKAHNEVVAQEVYDKIQKAGLEPSFPQVPEPNEHPLHFLITSLTALMGVLSVMAIILSGFLVFNTISALLAQQVRQIGIMKAVGARANQIIVMYLVLVACFGVLALLPSIPLARLATGQFTGLIAAFLNFDVAAFTTPAPIIALQAALSIILPVLAALLPVFSGTRITVREALDTSGGAGSYGESAIDRLMRRVRGLPRPVLLSLRNTFRRKGRVLLTLTTLVLGGALFIAVFSIRTSLMSTMQDYVQRLYSYDVEIYLDRAYRSEYLINQAQRIPGVVAAEAQVQTTVRRTFAGDREGEKIQMFAVPPETITMEPRISEGRWLLPEDDQALVISTGMQQDDPDIGLDSEIVLKIKDRATTWRVVGIMPAIGDYRWVFASYDYYGRVAQEVGKTSYLRIVTEQHSPAYQREMAAVVEQHLKDLGVDVSSTKTMAELSQGDQEVVSVIVLSLMFMAILVAVVGGLGLAGTMSLNVIERVREIGIVRAIGASDAAVLQMFITEGVVIGVISWAIGALLALPVSKMMSDTLGMMLFANPLTFHFSVGGVIIWLLLSVVLAVVASFLPAWNASRVSVRQVLAYE